jgi:hypothetical protein
VNFFDRLHFLKSATPANNREIGYSQYQFREFFLVLERGGSIGVGRNFDERRDVVVGIDCECGHAGFLLLPLVVNRVVTSITPVRGDCKPKSSTIAKELGQLKAILATRQNDLLRQSLMGPGGVTWPSAASSSLRGRTWRTANFPTFLPRSGSGPVSWGPRASTRRTCSARSWNSRRPVGGTLV